MGNIRRLGGGGGLVTRPHPLGPDLIWTASVTYSSSKVYLSLVRIITAYCTVMGCRESRSAPKDDAKARRRRRKDLYRISARFDESTELQSSGHSPRSSLSSTPKPVHSSPPPVPSSSSSAPSPPLVSNTPTNEPYNTEGNPPMNLYTLYY